MTRFFFSLSILLSASTPAVSADLNAWTITVRAYSHKSLKEFRELESVAKLVAQETANGFLNRTLISREAFHYGATYCLLMDNRVDSAEKQRERILIQLKKFHETESDTIFYEVDNPSDCFFN